MKTIDLLVIGEILVGHYETTQGQFNTDISGDVFNTLEAASGLGLKTAILTAVGADEYSSDILGKLDRLRVNKQWLKVEQTRKNGHYWSYLTPLPDGNRFKYERKESAYAHWGLLNLEPLEEALSASEWLLITGVSLATNQALQLSILNLVHQAKALGCKVAFDPNYRANLWASKQIAEDVVLELLPCLDLFLPSSEDLELLFGLNTLDETMDWLNKSGFKGQTLLTRGVESNAVWINECQVLKAFAPSLTLHLLRGSIGLGDAINAYAIEQVLRATRVNL